MTEKFLKLDPEKKRKIWRAICEEFTEHSYDDASTNRIVEKAGISKGTLFNYFGHKEGMYHALIQHTIDFFNAHTPPHFETRDFIERCRILGDLDLKIYRSEPELMHFLARLYVGNQEHVPPEIATLFQTGLTDALERLYKDVDTSLFPPDVDAHLLMRLIRYTFDGYMKEVTAKLSLTSLTEEMFEQLMDEHYQLLEEMKKIYYRKDVT